ncbi:MAG TPA: hypothetical protein VNI52_12300 [Sphingobacteriaceae bacterium]|nr:hypothetical protein [Sphingobacteriaceae bacterium]
MAHPELQNIQNKWKSETSSGNDLFHNKQYNLALKHYKQAQIASEIMFRNVEYASLYNIPAIQPFSVSCKNLANNFWVLKDCQKAEDYLFYNIWCLKKLSKRNDLNEKLKVEVTDEWNKGVLAFVDFYHKTGQALTLDFWKDETYNMIKDARQLLEKSKTYLN